MEADAKLIPLTQGRFTVVDAADYEWLSSYKWCLRSGDDGHDYAGAKHGGRMIRMHQLIMGVKVGEQVDHRDGDGLNNRRANLRVASPSQNGANKRPRFNLKKASRYKGVSWNKSCRKWFAQIMVNYKNHTLGYFPDPASAAKAYDAAAVEAFGEFARTNFKVPQ